MEKKKKKLFLFADDKIMYIENPEKCTPPKKIISANKWVQQDCRIRDQYRKINYISQSNDHSIQNEIKMTTPFIIVSKE